MKMFYEIMIMACDNYREVQTTVTKLCKDFMRKLKKLTLKKVRFIFQF